MGMIMLNDEDAYDIIEKVVEVYFEDYAIDSSKGTRLLVLNIPTYEDCYTSKNIKSLINKYDNFVKAMREFDVKICIKYIDYKYGMRIDIEY